MTDSAGLLFERLLDVMRRLRDDAGCPWDRAQSATTLKPFLLEEAYEVLEALDAGDQPALAGELGDLLFQVVFHAQLAAESGAFTIRDVLERVLDKMVRRHPHVFGDAVVGTAREALAQWEAIKRREGRAASVLAGVPRALPSLLRAQRVQAKAARVHFDWPDAAAAVTKVEEELAELRRAMSAGRRAAVEEELGDVLFSLVNVARLSDIDADEALRLATEKFGRRFAAMESALRDAGVALEQATPEAMERAWEAAKAGDVTP